MRITTTLLTFAAGGLLVGAALFAQNAGQAAGQPAAQPQGMPGMPKASPEHAMLKRRVGTWDTAFTMHMGPQTITDKGTMTWKMMGDFWLVGDYEGHMMGGPFHGHSMDGFDPEAKQFVSYWVDTSGPDANVSRGTWDEATHTMTMTSMDKSMETGELVKNTSKIVCDGADTIHFTMTTEGAKAPTMEITYTRKK
jgi:Protein of unknown function (DUF1579)